MGKLAANNTWMKNRNLNLVFRTIYQHSTISRAAISKLTGLSRSTVSQLSSELLNSGVIEECGSGHSNGGRRPVLLRIKPYSRSIAVIHIDDEGGLTLKSEDITGNHLASCYEFTLESKQLISKITSLLTNTTKLKNLALIVLALPGIISADGTIISAVNLGWKNIRIKSMLEAELGMPVLAENATALAAFGEYTTGNRTFQNLLYVRIDSAVGASMIIRGKLHRGLRGSAVEFGHMAINHSGKRCKCGRIGCVETMLSRQAVCKAFPLSLADTVNEQNVFEWLVENEHQYKFARNMLMQLANELATPLIDVINLLGPDQIVIENPLCESGTFWGTVNQKVNQQVLPVSEGEVKLAPSLLGTNAVLTGALSFGRKHYLDHAWLMINERGS